MTLDEDFDDIEATLQKAKEAATLRDLAEFDLADLPDLKTENTQLKLRNQELTIENKDLTDKNEKLRKALMNMRDSFDKLASGRTGGRY